MDFLLEYIPTDAHGFLLLCPFMPCVRPTLLKTRRGRCLSIRGKSLGTPDRGPGSLPRIDKRGGKGGHVVKSYLPALKS
jgi:hypothetical protein